MDTCWLRAETCERREDERAEAETGRSRESSARETSYLRYSIPRVEGYICLTLTAKLRSTYRYRIFL